VSNYPFSLLHDEARHLSGYPLTKGDVVIGNDVWIGYEALILSGVKIGDGAVIAARSVVSRDVEPYSIVGGTPAKHLRYRFSPEMIEELLKIAWWNWSFEEIRTAWHLIQSPQVEEFVTKYKN
jgi:acetyltransferase-like isoleucine patch superfamily enzyme